MLLAVLLLGVGSTARAPEARTSENCVITGRTRIQGWIYLILSKELSCLSPEEIAVQADLGWSESDSA